MSNMPRSNILTKYLVNKHALCLVYNVQNVCAISKTEKPSIAIFREVPYNACLHLTSYIMCTLMTGPWYNPNFHTTTQISFKGSPATLRPIANQSPTIRWPIASHLHPIGNQSPVTNQSPTGRRFLWTVLAHQSPTGPQLVGDWSPIDCRLIWNYMWWFWSHGGALLAAVFCFSDAWPWICITCDNRQVHRVCVVGFEGCGKMNT